MNELEKNWHDFTAGEISKITPLLKSKGITLDDKQPHISGERFLMSGKKVVLNGKDNATGNIVIIKSSIDPTSKKELLHEQTTRKALHGINFAYNPLLTPQEICSVETGDRLTIVTEYIDQPIAFLSLPVIKQFDLILGAFTMLEGVHATTNSHNQAVAEFGNKPATEYIKLAQEFYNEAKETITDVDSKYQKTLDTSLDQIILNPDTIDRYCGFLTHDDFALHNFRFTNDAIYLIDQSSLTFGNKHESWARLLNYLVLYNQPLEQAFTKYAKDNLAKEEIESLQLMRVFKLIELLKYHTKAASTSTDNVQKLSVARIKFWMKVLKAVLNGVEIQTSDIQQYKDARDGLRSEAEKNRQKVLQQLF